MALITVAVFAAVFGGALVQRISGVGFALIAGPSLTLLTGPYQGIRLTNLLTVLVSLIVLATSVVHVDGGRAKLLVPAGLLGVLPGLVLARAIPSGQLQLTIGAMVAVSLVAIMAVRRWRVIATSARTFAAGMASGFTNAAAGVGGPALTVYAIVTGWRQEVFAATSQISFAAQSAASLAIGGLPEVSTSRLVAVLCAITGGLAAGQIGCRHVHSGHASRAAVIIAALGALGSVMKGLMS
jgi:uncharacterized protein